MSALTGIADAVALAYAGGYAASPRTLSQNIHVERGFVPAWKLDELRDWSHSAPAPQTIEVYVATETEETVAEKSNREYLWIEYSVQVVLAAKPKATANADVDPLLLLLQELRDYFFKADRTAYALTGRAEKATKIETLAHPDLSELVQSRIFHAGFILTFEGYRLR